MAKKKAKNIVHLNVNSIQSVHDIPVLKVKAHLPEIVVDGYRIKQHTKALYLTFNLLNTEEFKVFSDFTSLEDHIEKINIYGKERLKKLTLGNILSNSIPTVSRSIMNGLIVKTYIDYILKAYEDYDGFNLDMDISEEAYNNGDLEPKRSRDLINKYSDTVLKILEG